MLGFLRNFFVYIIRFADLSTALTTSFDLLTLCYVEKGGGESIPHTSFPHTRSVILESQNIGQNIDGFFFDFWISGKGTLTNFAFNVKRI